MGIRNIRNGEQRSLIESGMSGYEIGPTLLIYEGEEIPIFIEKIIHKTFGQLNIADAGDQGYDSIEGLRKHLGSSYSDLGDETPMTLVYWRLR